MRRDTQVQASLLYGQMGSDIMALNKIIQKLKWSILMFKIWAHFMIIILL